MSSVTIKRVERPGTGVVLLADDYKGILRIAIPTELYTAISRELAKQKAGPAETDDVEEVVLRSIAEMLNDFISERWGT